MKSIAIIGGMGPEASEYMYKTLIAQAIAGFGAKNNNDFPDIVLFSVPVPDFISNEGSKRAAFEMLKNKVKAVNQNSVLCFSIACNTAHLLLDDLRSETSVPFVSMIDETVKKVQESGLTTVGLMGTPTTIKSGLYNREFDKHSIKYILPTDSQIRQLEKIIRNIIAGKNRVKDRLQLIKIADDLHKRGVQAIILGCTELPIIFPKKHKLPVFNSVEVLSESLLQKYYQQNTIGTTPL